MEIVILSPYSRGVEKYFGDAELEIREKVNKWQYHSQRGTPQRHHHDAEESKVGAIRVQTEKGGSVLHGRQ